MAPSIIAFAEFLVSEHRSFRTLEGVVPIIENGAPKISRTTLFAEAMVTIGNQTYLLCMPLSGKIDSAIAQTCASLERLRPAALTEYRVLTAEITLTDSMAREVPCDLVLHAIPTGESLDKAVTHIATKRLRDALELLKCKVVKIGFLHGNLKPANLIYGDDGRLYPIRYHYAHLNAEPERILEEFNRIEQFIAAHPEVAEIGEYTSPTEYEKRLPFDEIFPMHDLLRRVRHNGLYGYIDSSDRIVIEPQFDYAEDFFENRAVVRTIEGKMGVIDRNCHFVIEPIYDMVGFEDGVFEARLGDKWITIDFLGRIIEQ